MDETEKPWGLAALTEQVIFLTKRVYALEQEVVALKGNPAITPALFDYREETLPIDREAATFEPGFVDHLRKTASENPPK
jgi:hypothetical protein